ncbi:hypothetical protein, partial [Ruminococcus sp. 5_1_39BFAA]|uniref:hypothetical protein n=1 Tax=Ruminococcus sp. 5_1_39BFAA TaxID=457412 RepID=UPI0035631F77
AKPYISISYQKDSLSKDTRFFTASFQQIDSKILLFPMFFRLTPSKVIVISDILKITKHFQT